MSGSFIDCKLFSILTSWLCSPSAIAELLVFLALILIFLVLAKRLAGKSVFDMTYLLLSGTLNLNSVNQSWA